MLWPSYTKVAVTLSLCIAIGTQIFLQIVEGSFDDREAGTCGNTCGRQETSGHAIMLQTKTNASRRAIRMGIDIESSLVQDFLRSPPSTVRRSICLGFVVLLLLGCAFACWTRFSTAAALGHQEDNSSLKTLLERRMIQGVGLIAFFVCNMHSTAVIPGSYGLAHSFGYGATFSGCIISSAFALSGLLAPAWRMLLVPWPQPRNRILIILSTVLMMSMALLYSLAADPPESWDLSGNARMMAVVASRVFFGATPFYSMMRVLIQKVSSSEEMVSLNTCLMSVTMLGCGAGPMLSSVAIWALEARSDGAQAAAPLKLIGVIWACVAALLWCILPLKLDHLLHDDAQSPAAPQGSKPSESDLRFVGAERRAVCVWALAFSLERSFMTSALEAATSMILETEFKFATRDVGLLIGVVFLIGTMLCIASRSMVKSSQAGDVKLLIVLTVTCALSTCLMFTWVSDWLEFISASVGLGRKSGFLSLLLADIIIFPAGFYANGIAEGLMMQQAIPGTWWRQENLVIFSLLLVSFGRVTGAPFARFLVRTGGRNAYALCQLVLGVLATRCAWKTASSVDVLQSEYVSIGSRSQDTSSDSSDKAYSSSSSGPSSCTAVRQT